MEFNVLFKTQSPKREFSRWPEKKIYENFAESNQW